MRLDLSLLVGGFFAISGGTAFSQTQSPFAVEMLTNELSYMSPSDIADCWLLTKIYGESVPVFEKQAATWEKIFLQKAETGLINLPDLIKNSEVVQHSGDGAVELKGKPSSSHPAMEFQNDHYRSHTRR